MPTWALSLVVTATALTSVIVGILRQQGRLLIRIETLESALRLGPAEPETASRPAGLLVGAAAPEFSLPALDGTPMTLSAMRAAGNPVLLVFTNPSCSPCRTLMPEIAAWQRDHAARLTVALVSEEPAATVFAEAVEHGLTLVGIQEGREVADAYMCAGTPAAVLVSADGRIASPLATGTDQIRSMVADSVGTDVPIVLQGKKPHGHEHPHPAGPPVLASGSPAPPISLPRLGGGTVSSSDLLHSPTLVLFWDPGCSFCQQMAPQLKALEAEPPDTHHKLVVVSSGAAAANATIGLSSPVALDERRQVMQSFGIHGTPMAVLVDEVGMIVSDVAAGESAVLSLARRVRVEATKAAGQ